MPNPGQANNPDGINSFSGPEGQKEPAYGAVERLKAATQAVPVRSPGAAAPRRMQRRAVRGGVGSGQPAPSPAPPPPLPTAATDIGGEQQQVAFWTTLLNDPEASPLTRQYAQQALGQGS